MARQENVLYPLSRFRENWDRMFAELVMFKKKHGHSKVPADYADNLRLGRWVAAQRYRRKIGVLTRDQISRMDKIGFSWSLTDESWLKMYRQLEAFKRKRGFCDMPRVWPPDQNLANWVHNQRHRKRMKKLLPERVRLLEKLGFSWAIYKCDRKEPVEQDRETDRFQERSFEKLYYVANHTYVQYGGKGPMPPALEAYRSSHRGELPPYFPLPNHPTSFCLDPDRNRRKRVRWSGKGPLPKDVMAYLSEHGTLPPQT